VLNQPIVFDDSVLDKIPQWNEATHLDRPPTEDEVLHAIQILSSGMSPGADSIPPEIYKEGENQLVRRLSKRLWNDLGIRLTTKVAGYKAIV